MPNKIIGFSKLSRVEKIDWLNKNILDNSHQVKLIICKGIKLEEVSCRHKEPYAKVLYVRNLSTVPFNIFNQTNLSL